MRFHLKQYDSEAVVFDTASGDTHYLAPLALALLQICRKHAVFSREELLCLLAERHAIQPGIFSDAMIDETLEGLRKLELVSRR